MFGPLKSLRLVPVYTSAIVQHKGRGPTPPPTTERDSPCGAGSRCALPSMRL
jgi:hypothetical protein